jgi:hypothetical protein
MNKRDFWQSIIQISFVLVFYFGLGFAVLLATVFRRGFYVDDRYYLSKMMEGTAWRPFVYRVLVPKAAYIVGHLTPGTVQSTILRSVKRVAKKHQEILLGKHTEYRYEYLIVVIWITLALGSSALVWKHSLRQIMKYPEHVCWLLPICGILGLVPILLFYGPYVYDTTTLLLFSISIHVLYMPYLQETERCTIPSSCCRSLIKKQLFFYPYCFG